MGGIKTYSCGSGDGMFENEDKGFYVEKSDYDNIRLLLFNEVYDKFVECEDGNEFTKYLNENTNK